MQGCAELAFSRGSLSRDVLEARPHTIVLDSLADLGSSESLSALNAAGEAVTELNGYTERLNAGISLHSARAARAPKQPERV